MKKFIKTTCGIEKYEVLKNRHGIFNKIRFYWFVLLGSLRDIFK